MPTNTGTLVLTRNEKKTEARRAVPLALQCAASRTVRADGDAVDMYERVVRIIRHYGFSSFPLDRRDIALAIQKLHKQGVVRVRHYGPEFERRHSVTLLRT